MSVPGGSIMAFRGDINGFDVAPREHIKKSIRETDARNVSLIWTTGGCGLFLVNSVERIHLITRVPIPPTLGSDERMGWGLGSCHKNNTTSGGDCFSEVTCIGLATVFAQEVFPNPKKKQVAAAAEALRVCLRRARHSDSTYMKKHNFTACGEQTISDGHAVVEEEVFALTLETTSLRELRTFDLFSTIVKSF
ncbi:hypothetical protein Tco_1256542 [Tanacetum coccineum]